MKFGIITHYYKSKNLGGLLQAYAVVKILERMGIKSEQICYDNSIQNHYSKIVKLSRIVFSSNNNKKKILKRIIKAKNRPKITNDLQSKLKLQDDLFREFETYIPHSETVYNINTIHKANVEYDGFVTGSDQVWHPALLAHDAYFLSFVDRGKNAIPLSVSMGVATLSSYESKLFSSQIKKLSNISVREESLKNIISNLSKTPCSVILDPTLMLSQNDWLNISNKSILPNEQYVFSYFLGNCAWQRETVQKYAEKRGVKIIDIPFIMRSIRESDSHFVSESHWDIGPREFIAMINNAMCVFTDSFHAVAFSVNFQKNFYVFDRDGFSGKESMNSRVIDFLDKINLSERRIESPIQELTSEEINYKNVIHLLNSYRNDFNNWIGSQLKEVLNGK